MPSLNERAAIREGEDVMFWAEGRGFDKPMETLPYAPPKRFPDEFALTRIDGSRWTVTHLPTGHRVSGYWLDPKHAAKHASKVLRKAGVQKFRQAVAKSQKYIAGFKKMEAAP